MIHSLSTALVKDLILFLKKESGFLKLSAEQKEQKAPAFAALLKDMNEEEFLKDLEVTVRALKGSGSMSKSRLLQSLGRYFIKDFPRAFDQLNTSFFALSSDAQTQQLNELFPEQASFFNILKQQLLVHSPQEMTEAIVNFLLEVFQSPRVVVQSPMECSIETKESIREHFLKEYSHSFVAFSVNPQLIGGIRFFVDGKVEDHSWFARIADIRRLHQLVG